MGLGTEATTLPMAGCGDWGVGLLQATPSSALLVCLFAGRGECSFCSCCFLWIFFCSCCFASTDGDDSIVIWGWKGWAWGMGAKAETDCKGLTSGNRNTNIIYSRILCCCFNLHQSLAENINFVLERVKFWKKGTKNLSMRENITHPECYIYLMQNKKTGQTTNITAICTKRWIKRQWALI